MTLLITGLIEMTGEHGTGKTTAALECGAHPSKIRIYDDDIKGRSTVRNFELQTNLKIDYVDATKLRTSCKRDYEYYPRIKASLDEIKENQFDVIIFDTWTAIQKACRSYVDKYPEQFKDPVKGGAYFSGNSAMVNGQISRIGRDLESELLNDLEQKVKAIFLIAHLKDQYINSTQTGKQIPDDSATLERVPSTRIWYRANPASPVPISLFLKRPAIKRWNEQLSRIETVNLFPRKITPEPDDTSVWDAYARYFANPIGTRLPSPSETPTPYELSIIEGTLTPDQMNIYKAGTAIAASQAEQEKAIANMSLPLSENAIKAREMKSQGLSLPQIAQSLGISLPEIAKLLA